MKMTNHHMSLLAQRRAARRYVIIEMLSFLLLALGTVALTVVFVGFLATHGMLG